MVLEDPEEEWTEMLAFVDLEERVPGPSSHHQGVADEALEVLSRFDRMYGVST